MSEANKKAPKTYDAIVIGADVSGLIIAKTLVNQSKSVLILESQTQEASKASAKLGDFFNFDLMLSTPDELEQISGLHKDLGSTNGKAQIKKDFNFTVFEGSEFKPFYGFSENRFESCDSLNYFNHREFYDNTELFFADRAQFGEELLSQIHYGTEITKMDLQETGGATITLQNDKTFSSPLVFVTTPYDECKSFLPTEFIPAKVQLKLKKSKRWSAVHLIQHFSKPVSDSANVMLFFPTQRDNCEAVFGRIFDVTSDDSGNSPQIGLWTCMFNTEQLIDAEATAQSVRFLKKCINKAFGDLVEPSRQRIAVSPSWWSQPVEISKEITDLGKKTGVHLTDRSFFTSKTPLGALTQGVYSALTDVKAALLSEMAIAQDP